MGDYLPVYVSRGPILSLASARVKSAAVAFGRALPVHRARVGSRVVKVIVEAKVLFRPGRRRSETWSST